MQMISRSRMREGISCDMIERYLSSSNNFIEKISQNIEDNAQYDGYRKNRRKISYKCPSCNQLIDRSIVFKVILPIMDLSLCHHFLQGSGAYENIIHCHHAIISDSCNFLLIRRGNNTLPISNSPKNRHSTNPGCPRRRSMFWGQLIYLCDHRSAARSLQPGGYTYDSGSICRSSCFWHAQGDVCHCHRRTGTGGVQLADYYSPGSTPASWMLLMLYSSISVAWVTRWFNLSIGSKCVLSTGF